MHQSLKLLTDSMEDVFATLPGEDVIRESRAVVREYLQTGTHEFGTLRWAEFEPDGGFIRAGISEIELMSTEIISDSGEDKIIAEIAELVLEGDVKPGDLLASERHKGHFWCVPYRQPGWVRRPKDRMRAIFLTEAISNQILNFFDAEAGLTPSEQRIIYQIITGKNPGLAALEDGVSVETKRSQLKSAAAKLNCRGQTELVRLLVSQMIHLLYLCESETPDIALIEKFAARHFSANSRLSLQRVASGRVVRYLEFGPADGSPVLAMHGYLFPFLVLDADAELRKHGLRLIMPIRCGFLDNQSTSRAAGAQRLVDNNLEDLQLFAEGLSQKKIPVLGHNMGGIYALALAARRPELFSRAIVASGNFVRDRTENDTFAARFAGGLHRLKSHSGIYQYSIKQFQRKILSNRHIAKFVLRRLYNSNPGDLDAVNRQFGKGPAFEWFHELAVNSIAGVTADLLVLSGAMEDLIRDCAVPLVFLQGPDDPYTGARALAEYCDLNPKASFQVLKGGGHFTSASHPRDFWEAVKRHVSSDI